MESRQRAFYRRMKTFGFFNIFISFTALYFFLLFSKVSQLYMYTESTIHVYVYPLFFCISFPFTSPQSTEDGSLSYTGGSRELPILCMVSVHIHLSKSPNSSHPIFSPLMFIDVFIYLFSMSHRHRDLISVLEIRSSLLSRLHIYALIYDIYFFLTYCMKDSRSIHISADDSVSFLSMTEYYSTVYMYHILMFLFLC